MLSTRSGSIQSSDIQSSSAQAMDARSPRIGAVDWIVRGVAGLLLVATSACSGPGAVPPAAGTGVSRLLTDVERLCMHVPHWMASTGMTAAKIATFYDDPAKRAMDEHGLHMAEFRRSLTIDTDLRWRARRQLHFGRRRVMQKIANLSPAFAARLRGFGKPGIEVAT